MSNYWGKDLQKQLQQGEQHVTARGRYVAIIWGASMAAIGAVTGASVLLAIGLILAGGVAIEGYRDIEMNRRSL